MEKELSEINGRFQTGKHNQAINEIQTLLETFAIDDEIYRAHARLGQYVNFMGKHDEAIQAWTKALSLLEDEQGNVDHLTEQKFVDWINISLEKARVMHRQGRDGSSVSHKYNSDHYSSSNMNENEETDWKNERFQSSIKHYKRALDKLPQDNLDLKRRIRTELALVLFDTGNFDEAATVYEDVFNNSGDVNWLYKAAQCSWEQGNKDQAYARLQQLIATDATFAKAYQLSATYFTEKNEPEKAEEYTRKYRFYEWVPKFCQHIEYNPENVSLIEKINSDHALECLQTDLIPDTSKKSTEILAAICYHHYHGSIENKSFEELEKRGKVAEGEERDLIANLLTCLIKKHQSICTIKGAANALAGMKYDQTFETLANLLPQDVNLLYPMHIPLALAKLGDRRAVPLLIKMVKEPIVVDNDDSDSSDEMFATGGTHRLPGECCLALSAFFTDPEVEEVVRNAANNEETREMALVVLAVCTGEKQYWDSMEAILAEGNTLDYTVVKYLKEHAEKSADVENILKLNEEIYNKKMHKSNDDTNEKDD